jgi:ketopantoate hydroxymethyltransferase
MDQLITMAAAVRGTRRALVLTDLAFGSYQSGPQAALANAVQHLKEGAARPVRRPAHVASGEIKTSRTERADKSLPLLGGEGHDRPLRIFRVADSNEIRQVARNLHAVAAVR